MKTDGVSGSCVDPFGTNADIEDGLHLLLVRGAYWLRDSHVLRLRVVLPEFAKLRESKIATDFDECAIGRGWPGFDRVSEAEQMFCMVSNDIKVFGGDEEVIVRIPDAFQVLAPWCRVLSMTSQKCKNKDVPSCDRYQS